jgi:type II secretory pathway component PulM
MMLSARDKKLLVVIVALIVSALGYVYVIEPWLQGNQQAAGGQYREYRRLIDNASTLGKRFEALKTFAYWRETPQKQQIGLQLYMQDTARKAGITDITSLRVGEAADNAEVTSIQMECRTSVRALTNLLQDIAHTEAPVRIEQLRVYPDETDPNMVKVHVQCALLWQPVGRELP